MENFDILTAILIMRTPAHDTTAIVFTRKGAVMLDLIQTLLDSFPEGALLVRERRVVFANAAARSCLPGLEPGAPAPDCLPLPEPGETASGLFSDGTASYTYSCSSQGEDQLVFFRPAPQTALAAPQMDGVLRQLRELLGEVVAVAGPATLPGGEFLADSFNKSIYRLVRLTENLEYLSQAAGEGICFCPVTMDLAGLCRDVCRLAGPLLHEAGVGLECRLSAASLLISGDPALLQKLLLGLLSNAARAVEEGNVVLSLRARESRAYVAVSDSGDCPDPRHLIAMSQHGLSEGLPLPGQGAGLGLDIARHIAALHGGALMVSMGLAAPAVTLSLPTGPLAPRLSVRTPNLQRNGGLDPVLIELSDVLPARVFGLEGLD